MSIRRHTPLHAIALAALAVNGAIADESNVSRRHGTHAHGVATLNIAQQGSEVSLELESPAVNLVGFEHVPTSEEERKAVEQALTILKDGDRLFHFSPSADCRLAESRIDTPLTEQESTHEHGDSHADIVAEYHFTCARPGELQQLNLRLFQTFPATEELEVQYLTDKGAGAAELSPSNAVLDF